MIFQADAVAYTEWHRCYRDGWHDFIVDEAFAHPAKFAYGLIRSIYDHGTKAGFWKPGDVVGDPFGGIGTGGLVAAYFGLRWFGVELEPKFVGLARDNFRKHELKFRALPFGLERMPRIVQGDSRHFSAIMSGDWCACDDG